ncbi:MAG: hypothetical protein IKZ03_03300 [Clostridia bacterium]|nr:hypothetical protein [Clostridia bacterium]
MYVSILRGIVADELFFEDSSDPSPPKNAPRNSLSMKTPAAEAAYTPPSDRVREDATAPRVADAQLCHEESADRSGSAKYPALPNSDPHEVTPPSRAHVAADMIFSLGSNHDLIFTLDFISFIFLSFI